MVAALAVPRNQAEISTAVMFLCFFVLGNPEAKRSLRHWRCFQTRFPVQAPAYNFESMVRHLQVILACRRKQLGVCRSRTTPRLRARDAAILNQHLKGLHWYLRQGAVFSQQTDCFLTRVHDRRNPAVPHDRGAWSEVYEPRTLSARRRFLDAPVCQGGLPIRKDAGLVGFHEACTAKVHEHIARRD